MKEEELRKIFLEQNGKTNRICSEGGLCVVCACGDETPHCMFCLEDFD